MPPDAPRVDRVLLKRAARATIVNELCDWDAGPHLESRETGAYFAGKLDGSTLIITRSFSPGPNTVRGYGRLGLDAAYTETLERACMDDEVVCGTYHSHPDRPEPSSQDMAHWASEARYFRGRSFTVPLFLGLTVVRNANDWGFPRFYAWLSRGDKRRADQIDIDIEEERW